MQTDSPHHMPTRRSLSRIPPSPEPKAATPPPVPRFAADQS